MDFDECAEEYQNLLDDNLRRWGKDTLYYSERKVQFVDRHVLNRTPSSILEFGCGGGQEHFMPPGSLPRRTHSRHGYFVRESLPGPKG